MARIRTIKPEFWPDEKLALQDALTRLVFLGLISHADDAGRLVDSIRLIDGLLFPFTDESSAEPIEKLVELRVIRRGRTASGQAIIQIVNWHHQKIDKPNLSSALPPIAEESPTDRRNVVEASTPHISISTGISISTDDQRSTNSQPVSSEQKPARNGKHPEREPVPQTGDLPPVALPVVPNGHPSPEAVAKLERVRRGFREMATIEARATGPPADDG